MRRVFTQEQKDFIRDHVVGRTCKELTDLFNERFSDSLSTASMKRYKINHHLRSGTPNGLPPADNGTKMYPEEIWNFISENAKGTLYKDLCEMVNDRFGTEYAVSQIATFCQRHDMQNGITGFVAGNVPVNKGKHVKSTGRSIETQFKKGCLPANTVPIGHKRINKGGYIQVKTKERPDKSNNNFSLYHRIVWEEHYGQIPAGCSVVFLDGNKLNCDISNLALLTRAELQYMNIHKLFSTDPELTRTGIAIAKLYTTARKLEREKSDAGKESA